MRRRIEGWWCGGGLMAWRIELCGIVRSPAVRSSPLSRGGRGALRTGEGRGQAHSPSSLRASTSPAKGGRGVRRSSRAGAWSKVGARNKGGNARAQHGRQGGDRDGGRLGRAGLGQRQGNRDAARAAGRQRVPGRHQCGRRRRDARHHRGRGRHLRGAPRRHDGGSRRRRDGAGLHRPLQAPGYPGEQCRRLRARRSRRR